MRKIFLLICLSCFTFMAWGQDLELIRKAESGDAEAQYELGHKYQSGEDGFESNLDEAKKWYLKAAELGNSNAQVQIAFFYNYGLGGPKDLEKAEYWFLKAAAQSNYRAYDYLALFYEYNKKNKEKAIYWYKKIMDSYYDMYGSENESAAKSLRELGVYYHPGSKSSSIASSSRTSKSSNGNASPNSTKRGLLYRGTYTQSPQGYCPEMGTYTEAIGPGFRLTIEIYDSYITVDGSKCEYVSTSNGWKTYKGSSMFGSTPYYKVNPNNFEMSYYTISTNPYTAQTNTFIYQMQKGEATFNIHQNNSATNGGGYSTGRGTSNRTNTTTKTYKKDCHLCHGSGKCSTCNGKHRYLNPLTNKYVTCPNCRPDGRCSACGGTGKEN